MHFDENNFEPMSSISYGEKTAGSLYESAEVSTPKCILTKNVEQIENYANSHSAVCFTETGLEPCVDLLEYMLLNTFECKLIFCKFDLLPMSNPSYYKLVFSYTCDGVHTFTIKYKYIEVAYNQQTKYLKCRSLLNKITQNFLNFINAHVNNNMAVYGVRMLILHCKYDAYCVIFDTFYELGSGSYGTIYKAYSRTRSHAIKIIVPRKNEDLYATMREIVILNKLRHDENVMKIRDLLIIGGTIDFNDTSYKQFQTGKHKSNIDGIKQMMTYISDYSVDNVDPDEDIFDENNYPNKIAIFMILEYLRGCTLGTYVGCDRQLSMHNRENLYKLTQQQRIWGLQKLKEIHGLLKYSLHANNIVHGDIKSDNIMVSSTISDDISTMAITNIKLIDYGFACEKLHDINDARQHFTFKGTLNYLYPLFVYYQFTKDQKIKNKLIDIHCNILDFAKITDIWSLLITACELHCINPLRYMLSYYAQITTLKNATLNKDKLYLTLLNQLGGIIIKYMCTDSSEFFDFVDRCENYFLNNGMSAKYVDMESQMYIYVKEFFIKLKKGDIEDLYNFVYMVISDLSMHM